jgi:hypothetical protein
MDTFPRSARFPGQPGSASWAHGGPPQSDLVDRYGRPVPSPAALVGVSLWALGSGIVGSLVAVAALITIAGDPPAWYQPSMLVTGGLSLAATIGGLWLAEMAWLRWKLLAIGTAAIVVAALLTVAALTGTV